MRVKEAPKLCPHLIQRPARPERYVEVSTRIMETLQRITPVVEVFSVDEAFLDLTKCQKLYGSKESLGRQIKQIVFQASGVKCSVDISGDKTTAKFAAKLEKPDGLTIISPWEVRERLKDVPVTQLCGVDTGWHRCISRQTRCLYLR